MPVHAPLAPVFAVGAIVAAAVQPFTPTGWWLNSGAGVATAGVVMGLLGLSVLLVVPRRLLRTPLALAAALWLGVMAGFAGVLFVTGPGTIFPIVLAVAAILSAPALAVGAVAGLSIRWLVRR